MDGVWYTLLPNGNPDPGTATIQSESGNGTSILADAGVVNGVVATLYAFSADTPDAEQLHRDVRPVLAAGPHPERADRVRCRPAARCSAPSRAATGPSR